MVITKGNYNVNPYLKFNNDGVLPPTTMNMTLLDIVSDKWTDSATGSVHFNVIWQDCIKLSIVWENINDAQLQSLLSYISPRFTVTFIHPKTNEYYTGIFYEGDRNIETDDVTGSKIYTLSVNLVEKEQS